MKKLPETNRPELARSIMVRDWVLAGYRGPEILVDNNGHLIVTDLPGRDSKLTPHKYDLGRLTGAEKRIKSSKREYSHTYSPGLLLEFAEGGQLMSVLSRMAVLEDISDLERDKNIESAFYCVDRSTDLRLDQEFLAGIISGMTNYPEDKRFGLIDIFDQRGRFVSPELRVALAKRLFETEPKVFEKLHREQFLKNSGYIDGRTLGWQQALTLLKHRLAIAKVAGEDPREILESVKGHLKKTGKWSLDVKHLDAPGNALSRYSGHLFMQDLLMDPNCNWLFSAEEMMRKIGKKERKDQALASNDEPSLKRFNVFNLFPDPNNWNVRGVAVTREKAFKGNDSYGAVMDIINGPESVRKAIGVREFRPKDKAWLYSLPGFTPLAYNPRHELMEAETRIKFIHDVFYLDLTGEEIGEAVHRHSRVLARPWSEKDDFTDFRDDTYLGHPGVPWELAQHVKGVISLQEKSIPYVAGEDKMDKVRMSPRSWLVDALGMHVRYPGYWDLVLRKLE